MVTYMEFLMIKNYISGRINIKYLIYLNTITSFKLKIYKNFF